MTQIKLYNGEKYERGKWWYIIFSSFFIFVITVSLLLQNWQGALFIMFLLGGYILFSLLNVKKINVSIQDDGLKIDDTFYSIDELRAFCLELDPETQNLKNIVFFIGNSKLIHTFVPGQDKKVMEFIKKLNDKVPRVGEYSQPLIDRLIRYLRI